MNIFYTDPNPHIAANQHCNIHQVKMILEYSQLLSTAHHVLGSDEETLANVYKKTHENHPSAVWVRQSKRHYAWLFNCLMQLHKLFCDRTGKDHASVAIVPYLRNKPRRMSEDGFTPPTLAMPEKFKQRDHALAYQSYLNGKFDEWESRDNPLKCVWTTRKPEWRKKHESN